MLRLQNITFAYGSTPVLDLSLELATGELYALIGPSGCGKSTLLRMLCGIIQPQSGNLSYNGRTTSARSPLPSLCNIGYVPQNYGLLEWKDVKSNILLPLLLKRTQPNPEDFGHIISTLGLDALLGRYPGELSGGQKQRVALARAFVARPDILLLDEAFSALDAFTAEASQKLFLELWQDYKATTLFITHNIYEAASMGRKILLMQSGGKISKIIDPVCNCGAEREEAVMHMAGQLKAIFGAEFGTGAQA